VAIEIKSTQMAKGPVDLNDLRVFAYVASLSSFSSAAEALQLHKSSVSRSIARLETMLEAPLLQRTTRKVMLTRRGVELNAHCIEMLSRVDEAIGKVTQCDDSSPQTVVNQGPGTLAWVMSSDGRMGA
jgi:DNA-binding transcriptional LysR family regulator